MALKKPIVLNNNKQGEIKDTDTLSVGSLVLNGVIRLKNYTVSTLPIGIRGDTAYVIDALAPTFGAVLIGGGAIVSKVFFNGTNWTTQ